MAIRRSDAGSAIVTLLTLVVLPIAAFLYLAPDAQRLTSSSLDLREVLYQTVALGVVITILALIKAVIDKASISHLFLSVASEVVSLAFALLVVGVGNIENLGYSSFRISQGKLTTIVALDLRVFLWLTFAVVAAGVLKIVAQFMEVRAERATAQPK